MDNAVVGILSGAAAGIVTNLLNQLATAQRDKRRIAADVDRRKEEREDRRIIAENVALEATRKQSVIVAAVATQKTEVLGAIKENTQETRAGVQVAHEAFSEANGNAAKFAEVHRLMLQLQVDGKRLYDYTHEGMHDLRNALTEAFMIKTMTNKEPAEENKEL